MNTVRRSIKNWNRDKFPRHSKFMQDDRWWDGSGCVLGLHQPYLRRRKLRLMNLGSIWKRNSKYEYKS